MTDEQLGNGLRVKSTYDPTTGLLSTRKSGNDTPATNRQELAYLWDANGNLTRRTDNRQLVVGVSLYEQFNYDEIDRLSSTSSNAPSYTALALTVNAIGNIMAKSDFPGTYSYPASGGSSVRPHAVSSVGSTNYVYDANGNMTSRGGNSISWTSYGVPSAVNGSGGLSSQFTYTPNRDRWKQTATYSGPATETTLYVAGVMEKVTRSGSGVTTYRHYISAGSSTVVFVNFSDTTTPQTYYVTKDQVDSTNVVTNSAGTIVVNESFDAFGGRRDSDWVGPVNSIDETAIKNSIRRGYTGHEHLDNLGLVHMNGRIQDPALGRFVSADPFIPDPGDSQSLNRYSYVRNRPLSATDPNGFEDTADNQWYNDVDHYGNRSSWCVGGGCAIDWLWANSISDSYAIEARANGAVAGIRPDLNSVQEVSARPLADLLVTQQQVQKSMAACAAAAKSGSITENAPGCVGGAQVAQAQKTGQPLNLTSSDVVNPSYIGKVTVSSSGDVTIDLSVAYTGDIKRAKGAAAGVRKVFAGVGVAVNFTAAASPATADLVIRGASLADFVQAGVACTCAVAEYVGGWGPFYQSAPPGFQNVLYVNVVANGNQALLDAHEFGHKLGLAHRKIGIMAYPPNIGPPTKDDVDRLRYLYDYYLFY